LPKDANGLYYVLTASDVAETSGFCTHYCGCHTSSTIGGTDIRFAFVGNPGRCPSACEMQTVGGGGADGMASIMMHEASEAITDPDLNAWYDSSGNESADQCTWKFGPVTGTRGQGAYNQTFGTYNCMIQMEWENTRGGAVATKPWAASSITSDRTVQRDGRIRRRVQRTQLMQRNRFNS
jgi:hypothetical protein